MSTLMHPVGPEPPGVYWVRRAVVLAVVLVVVLGIVWFVGGRGSGTAAAGTPAPSASSHTASGTPIVPVEPSPSVSRSTSPSPSSSASPSGSTSGTPTCTDAAIAVTVSTDAASYPVGATPRLRMRITNSSAKACRRDVGAAANELVVNKGGTRFWSSDDCNPGGKANPVTLAPGQSYSVTLSWLAHASQPGCPPNQPAAAAGSYTLVGRNGTEKSAPEPFSLT